MEKGEKEGKGEKGGKGATSMRAQIIMLIAAFVLISTEDKIRSNCEIDHVCIAMQMAAESR